MKIIKIIACLSLISIFGVSCLAFAESEDTILNSVSTKGMSVECDSDKTWDWGTLVAGELKSIATDPQSCVNTSTGVDINFNFNSENLTGSSGSLAILDSSDYPGQDKFTLQLVKNDTYTSGVVHALTGSLILSTELKKEAANFIPGDKVKFNGRIIMGSPLTKFGDFSNNIYIVATAAI